jgi:hypothetical protein
MILNGLPLRKPFVWRLPDKRIATNIRTSITANAGDREHANGGDER